MGLLEAAKDCRCLLTGFDPNVYSGADCAVLAEEFAAAAKAFHAASVLAAARAVDCDAHRGRGFADGADWVAHVSGSTGSQARQALRTAGQLEEAPDTRQAALSGDISLPQAGEVGGDGELLEVARKTDLTRLRDVARDKRMASVSAEELHERQRRARHFRHWRDQMGMVCFTGALPPHTGLPLVRQIDIAAANAALAARKTAGDGPAEGRDAHAADALVQLVTATTTGGKRLAAGTELVIVADINALRRGHAHEGEPCHIIGGGPIPPDLVKELSRDAFIKAVLHDGTNIHTVSHLGRHLPAVLRTAIEIGNPPTFDGLACVRCGKKWGLQLDHDNPVANQGPTAYRNLQPLCWQDHHIKTEQDRQAGLLGPNTPPNPRPKKKPPGPPP